MNIALDFDDTYTRDPELWDSFVRNAQDRGHEVWCVTMRDGSRQEVIDTIGALVGKDHCIFTAQQAKAPFMWELGIRIDVWIDDSPQYVNKNKTLFQGIIK